MKKINTLKIMKQNPRINEYRIPANAVFATNIVNLSSRLKAKAIPFDNEDCKEKMDDEEYAICETMLEVMLSGVLTKIKIDGNKYTGTMCAKASDRSIKHLKNFSDPIQFYIWLKYTLNACGDGFGAWKNVSITDRAVVIDIISGGIDVYTTWARKRINKVAEEKKEESNE